MEQSLKKGKKNTSSIQCKYTKTGLASDTVQSEGKYTVDAALFKGEFSSYISLMTENPSQRRLYNFRGSCFLIPNCILHSVCPCQSARRGRLDFKRSCPIEQHITALPALPLKRPGLEHAQWRPVNKSLVEALMAVAHLVRLCADPESDRGPPTYHTTQPLLTDPKDKEE